MGKVSVPLRYPCYRYLLVNLLFLTLLGEFYAATEGNANLLNFVGRQGAVGFVPTILDSIYTVKLAKYDIESDDFVRDANGFCIPAQIGEPGHLCMKPSRSFVNV